ncbi:MAG TPA: HEAT repeat domain-containing protein [Pyrinomonadaceae bacterium]|nr:HEAT repeat domain-containing protein [Pyrinomonadaceae bacterium]
MPRKSLVQIRRNWRPAFAATLLCALVAAALTWGALASLAQGGDRRARAQQQSAQGGPKLKLTPLRSSESTKGSRVTITGTDSLGDYQSYRSGERFYVRIPNADAGAVRGGVRGRGFEDAQVQRSGGDVILSFRVKPGARPSVKQRFNQLDVEFAAPEGSAEAQTQNTRAQANDARPSAVETTTRDAGSQTRTSASQTTSQAETAEAARREAEQRAQSQNATRQAGESLPPVADLPDQLAPPQDTQQQTQPEPSSPAATAETPTEIAQAGQPASQPPGTATTTGAPLNNQQTATFGAALARNWGALAAVAAILAVGLGLFFVARRSSAQTPPAVMTEEVAGAKTAKLKEPSAPALDDAPATLTTATVATTATAFVPVTSGRDKKKKKKARGKGRRDEYEVAAKDEAPAVGMDEMSAATEAAVIAPVSSVAADEAEASKVDESVADGASAAATFAASEAVAESSEVAEEESSKAVEPVAQVYDAETVQNETRRLLEGETYDAAVLATGDRSTRQMIAAELLAALAARNPARKERARTAFIEHGYFNEAARDLREAEAPAERASAARSLGLVCDRIATPHLAASLEDSSVEVRRAAVEALASVRDPEAVTALEELITREKSLKTKVPRKFVQRAIEACAEAPPLPPPSLASATAATVLAGEATRAEEEAPAAYDATAADTSVTAIAPVEPAEEEATPTAVEESTPTLAEEATPTLVEESTPTIVEEATPTIVERSGETLVERADRTLVEEPSDTIVEGATPTIAESAAPTLFEHATPTLFEEASTPTALDASAPATETAVEQAPVEEEAAVEEEPAVSESPAQETAVGEASAPEAVTEAAAPQAVEVAEPEPAEAEAVSETASVTEIEPVSFVEQAESYESAEVYEPVARELDAPPAAGEESVEIAPFVASEEAVESQRDAEASEPARFEDFEALAGAPRPDEWVELDFGVTETTPAQFSAESEEAAQPASFQTYTEELFAPPAAEEAREAYAPAETEAADAPPVSHAMEFVSTADEAASPAGVEPYVKSTPVSEGALVTPARDGDATPRPRAQEKGLTEYTEEDYSTVPKVIRDRLTSVEPVERAEAVKELARVESGEAFEVICGGFDDPAADVRSAAARSLYELQDDRADSFTRALREATPQRRRNIGAAIASSGLASEAISNLTGESREKTYDAFSLLFLMAKAGEVQPLVRAVEGHPDGEVRLAVVKLLALSGQKDVLPAFRRLAVRGTLPAEVRAAVMEAIYQISSQETQKA